MSFLVPLNATDAAPPKVSFNRDIRPILSDNCFQCHGPDEKQRQGKLRLDVKEHAFASAESGKAALVSGKVDASELAKRIVATNKDELMPPPSSGKQLKPREIELLKQWIAEGAEYQGHWAFIAPTRPEVPIPTPALKQWPKNPIDNFVLAKMQGVQLTPAKEASKETLIRRVSLDLTGLPPTLKEIDDFLSDNSAQAYEKVVDRLLKSPHYGERMALQWLDFARYADSNGFQVDSSRFNWPWRDWVIKAFNDNMPFDQFTVEQLAGDMLPNASRSQILATGFNRNHRLNGEGGIIAEEWRVETVIDRVETTGMTWLALTLNCCRCHDHKYDPISQKDFYGMFAFFNNVTESGTLQGESKNTEPTIQIPTEDQQTILASADNDIKSAEARVTEELKKLPELIAAWEPDFKSKLNSDGGAVWQPFAAKDAKSTGGSKLTKQPDGSYLAGGKNPAHDIYTITGPIAAGGFSGVLLETLPDASLPNQSLGRFSNGNFVLSRIEAEITAPSLKEPLKANFKRAEATYSQKGWEIGLTLDGNSANGWAVDGPTRRDATTAMFIVDALLSVPEKATLTVKLHHEALNQHNIGRFRLSTTKLPPSTVKIDGAKLPESLKAALETEFAKRTPAQKTEIETFFRANVDSSIRQAEAAVAARKAKRDGAMKNTPTAMVMREADKPRDSFVLIRGQYDKRGDKVEASLPAVFPPMPAGQPMNRLGFAKWIVDPSNPLTARVWVNRAFERFFGTGIVKTTENFGSQAEWPSHPELLDWLATEFMQSGWNMKAMQKLMVMSATYRQSTHASDFGSVIASSGNLNSTLPSGAKGTINTTVAASLFAVDPDNRLLARGPRFRLGAEQLRDQALAVSGLLVPKLGGPSVRPYMPDGVWDETSRYGDLRGYKHETGDGLYRRTLYTIWKRTAAPPSMLLFDAPSREICTVKRSRTNTPLQALVLLNEVTYVEAAKKLAERMLSEGGSTAAERLAFGFRLATGRRPTSAEVTLLTAGFNADAARFATNKESATQLLATGESKPDSKFNVEELAAYALTANVLLNLDEVVTRE